MDRRQFLINSARGAVVLTGLALWYNPLEIYNSRFNKEKLKQKYDEIEKDLAVYGIKLDEMFSSKEVGLEGNQLDIRTVGTYKVGLEGTNSFYLKVMFLETLRGTVYRYPPKEFKQFVERFHTYSRIDFKHTILNFLVKFYRLGIASPQQKEIILKISIASSTLDHEIGHMIADSVKKDDWLALGDGFVRDYGKDKYNENVATTIEYIYGHHPNTKLNESLSAKVAYLKRLYEDKLDVSEDYWEMLNNPKTNLADWKKYWSRQGRL